MASLIAACTGASRDDHDQARLLVLRGHPDRRIHGRVRTALTSLAGRPHPQPIRNFIRKLTRSRGWLYATMRGLELSVEQAGITSATRGFSTLLLKEMMATT
jgi:hypothetical protein